MSGVDNDCLGVDNDCLGVDNDCLGVDNDCLGVDNKSKLERGRKKKQGRKNVYYCSQKINVFEMQYNVA